MSSTGVSANAPATEAPTLEVAASEMRKEGQSEVAAVANEGAAAPDPERGVPLVPFVSKETIAGDVVATNAPSSAPPSLGAMRGEAPLDGLDSKYDADVDDIKPQPGSYGRSSSLSHTPEEEDETDLYNLPPGRMHVTRGHTRLYGSTGNLPGMGGSITGSSASGSGGMVTPPSPRSRSRSPSTYPRHGGSGLSSEKATATTNDANSSISSLEDLVDQDILYDRAGRSDLDERKLHSSRELNLPPLPSVNERLSEDTLEDVHAFSDAAPVRSSNASRVSQGTTQDNVLEPLDELDEEGMDDDDDDVPSSDHPPATTVILTNMENLHLEQEKGSSTPQAVRLGAGESISEAPTA